LVEFTLVVPLLVILTLGLVEFGRALMHYHVVEKSMRDAARYLARVEATCPSGAGSGSLVDATDETEAKNLALYGFTVPGGETPLLPYWTNPATVTVNIQCTDNSGGALRGPAYIPIVRVSAAVPYQDLGMLAMLGFGSVTFSVSHEELNIGE
jgi:Flp pilus assembly protein TadG